jgi:Predicted integral membrane protein
MKFIEKAIEVEAPLSKVYHEWIQFEQFPRFMEGVSSVRRVDDQHLHWVAEIGGHKREWDAEILEQVPGSRIAWRSTSGSTNSGAISFHANDPAHTLISFKMEYEPDGALEMMGASLGVLSRRIEGDLERFKQFIQSHQKPRRSDEISRSQPGLEADYGTSGKSGV